MRIFSSNHVGAAALAVLLLAGAASLTPALAQATDARWQPWLGCWSQVSDSRLAGAVAAKDMVCVVPAQTGDGVEVAVMAEGKLVRSDVIVATNQRVPKTIESCPGWETVAWSADGRRLMVRSEVRCAQTIVKSSSIFAISSQGEWIEVRGALVGASSTVSVVRYAPAAFALRRVATAVGGEAQPFSVVSEVGVSSRYARLAAGDRVDADAVLDVTKHVDAPVAEAWLNELQQDFELDARELVRLADAGMPPNVIDLMVALSNPKQFAVRRSAEPGQSVREVRRGTFGGGSGYGRRYGSVYDCGYGYLPTTYGYYGDPCYPSYLGYGAYGYGSGYFGYGYGSRYGYGSYGGYYYGSRPLVIVPAGTITDRQRGQAVKGAGYTRRDGGTSPSVSRPQSSTTRDPAPSRGSSSGQSTGSSSGSSSSSGSTGSSGGDGGRTAKPRVPPG